MKWKSQLGVSIGRVANRGMRLIGRDSTALPGYLAERFERNSLGEFMRGRVYGSRILITGTNGKTTTTHALKTILEADGRPVVSNSSGSNLSRGVLTALMQDNRQGEDVTLLLEVDEASMPAVVAAAEPTHCVILNLFRDQLDRYGEVDTTQKLLVRALIGSGAELILNGDDPWVAMIPKLTGSKRTHYFGLNIDGLQALPHDFAADQPVAPLTQAHISYQRRYFGHLGIYAADDGSFKRPALAVDVRKFNKQKTGQQKLHYMLQKKQHSILTNLSGTYNAYNIAAVLLTSSLLGMNQKTVEAGIQSVKPAFGRQEILSIDGKVYQFYLIKNPSGFNQVIQQACTNQTDTRPILFIINDNFADGRDVSWLWDTAVEDIQPGSHIIVSGLRAYDMALRLEYAGLPCQVVPDPIKALQTSQKLAQADLGVRVLPTYTGLLQLRKHLALKLEHTI